MKKRISVEIGEKRRFFEKWKNVRYAEFTDLELSDQADLKAAPRDLHSTGSLPSCKAIGFVHASPTGLGQALVFFFLEGFLA